MEIHEAKEVLLRSVNTLIDDELKKKIRPRRGDGRTEQELDDTFALINDFDEKQTLSQLPIFVSDSVDKMLSKSIVEGDMRAILSRFGKLEQQISRLQNTVNKLTSEVAAICSRQPLVNMQAGLFSLPRSNMPVVRPSAENMPI